jgi:putative hydrolase of the HAD superfamily
MPKPPAGARVGFGNKAKIGFLLVASKLFATSCDAFVQQKTRESRNRFSPLQASLGILTFDLDDTLFPTTDVVRAANDKMIRTMIDRGCKDTTLPKFLATTKSIRSKLDGPITYTNLRKSAIRKTFDTSTEFDTSSVSDMDSLVFDCYNAWEEERHAAAERFLFPDAIEIMKELRALYPDTCFAAITNGAGDPLQMPNTLAPFFDFRVSGEDDEVFPYRKPNGFIYEYTLTKYSDTFPSDGEGTAWCHVGDCLANDVGASTACGAKAIWMCLEDDKETAASRLVGSKGQPQWSTASQEELDRRKKEIEEGKKSVDATIYNLKELPGAIASVLEESNLKC